MKTALPIATISYNSPMFLAKKLGELEIAKKIQFWAFISHQPEDDEAGNKPHIHLFVVPAKMIQTVDLKDHFAEFDPSHPDKPLNCINWRKSNFDNWYLYAIHDKRYLAMKGQSRKHHYSFDDVAYSDFDELTYSVRSIDLLSLSPYQDMIDAQAQGVNFPEYFRRGTIPLPQVALYERAWYLLLKNKTDRNGNDNHEF